MLAIIFVYQYSLNKSKSFVFEKILFNDSLLLVPETNIPPYNHICKNIIFFWKFSNKS